MTINIDAQIKNTEKVTIGGKEYDVIFNDEFEKSVTKVILKASNIVKDATKLEKDEKANEMSLNEQSKFVFDKYDEAKGMMIDFFDKYLGQSEGERIYAYFKKDTQALIRIMVILKETSENLKKTRFNNKKRKYINNKR